MIPPPRSLRDEFAAGAEVDVAGKGAHDAPTGQIVEGRGGREGGGDATQGGRSGIGEAHNVGGGGFCGSGGGERQARHGMAVAVSLKMAFQLEGQAGFLSGEARVARFSVAAGGEEVALVGESAPLEGKVRNILHQRREVEGRGEGLVRADGVGGEIGIFEVHDREGIGVGGIVGGVFRALLHDSDAHRVGRRKDLVAVAQYQARVEGQGAEQEGEKEGETGAHARRVGGRSAACAEEMEEHR